MGRGEASWQWLRVTQILPQDDRGSSIRVRRRSLPFEQVYKGTKDGSVAQRLGKVTCRPAASSLRPNQWSLRRQMKPRRWLAIVSHLQDRTGQDRRLGCCFRSARGRVFGVQDWQACSKSWTDGHERAAGVGGRGRAFGRAS